MATLLERIKCPFCGTERRLSDMPIVATLTKEAPGSGGAPNHSVFADLETDHGDGRRYPRSGATPLGWVGGGKWPVIGRMPSESLEPRKRSEPQDPPLPRLDEVASPMDRAARVCVTCAEPLPTAIDDRDYFIIAVVGINTASKTHYIASALHEGYVELGLDVIGCREFEPDGRSGETFHDNYNTPLFEDRRAFPPTQVDRFGVRHREPLAFRARMEDGPPVLLMIHDLAGEDFSRHDTRPFVAPFLKRADAIIFLVDPRWIPGIREKLSLPPDVRPGFDQVHVFTSVIEELASKDTPIAVTIAKSDLLSDVLPGRYRFMEPPSMIREERLREIELIDEEVRELLVEFKAGAIVRKAEQLKRVSFHAVAAIGCNVAPGEIIPDLRPLRVLDPLISVLRQIDGVSSSA